MKKKKWIIAIIVLVLLLGMGFGVWFFLNSRGSGSGDQAQQGPLFADVLAEHASSQTDPRLKASATLILADEVLRAKDYDRAIAYLEQVLNQSDAPDDMKQAARGGLMYTHNLNGDNTEALRYAREYKQNISTADLELKSKEDSFIDQQIAQLESNQPLQAVDDAVRGD